MIIDLKTAWSDNTKGGKGKKATYETKLMRVPLPLESLVSALIWAFTKRGVILEIEDVLPEDFYSSRHYKEAIAVATQRYIDSKNEE